MYCPFCGKKNLAGDRYCAFCGKRLTQPPNRKENNYRYRKRQPSARSYGPGIVFFFIEIVIMAASLAFLVISAQNVYSPEHVVEKYVKAKVKQDWNALYDMFLVEETNEFLNKQAYVTAQTINQKQMDVSEVGVEEIKPLKAGEETQSYLVGYQKNGEAGEMEVTVLKKNLTWKVKEDLGIVNNFQISVPKGASLTVDKIPVPSKMKIFDNNSPQDLYTITKVFGPTHYVEVEGNGFEPVARLYTMPENGESIQVEAGYAEELKEKMAKQAFADLNAILTGAANDKNYSSIPLLKGLNGKNKNELLEAYTKIKNETFENDNEDRDLIDYALVDCKAEVKADVSDSKNLVQVKIKGKCTMEFVNHERWKADIETKSGNCTYTLKYVNENGKFSLYSAAFHFPMEEEEE